MTLNACLKVGSGVFDSICDILASCMYGCVSNFHMKGPAVYMFDIVFLVIRWHQPYWGTIEFNLTPVCQFVRLSTISPSRSPNRNSFSPCILISTNDRCFFGARPYGIDRCKAQCLWFFDTAGTDPAEATQVAAGAGKIGWLQGRCPIGSRAPGGWGLRGIQASVSGANNIHFPLPVVSGTTGLLPYPQTPMISWKDRLAAGEMPYSIGSRAPGGWGLRGIQASVSAANNIHFPLPIVGGTTGSLNYPQTPRDAVQSSANPPIHTLHGATGAGLASTYTQSSWGWGYWVELNRALML